MISSDALSDIWMGRPSDLPRLCGAMFKSLILDSSTSAFRFREDDRSQGFNHHSPYLSFMGAYWT